VGVDFSRFCFFNDRVNSPIAYPRCKPHSAACTGRPVLFAPFSLAGAEDAGHESVQARLKSDPLSACVVENNVIPFVLSDDDDDDDNDRRRGVKTPMFFQRPHLHADDSTLPGAVDDERDDVYDLVAAAAAKSQTASQSQVKTNDSVRRRQQMSVIRSLTTDIQPTQ